MKPISALCPRWSKRRRSNWVEKNHREMNCWHFDRWMELSYFSSREMAKFRRTFGREISLLTWLWPLKRWRIDGEKVNPKSACSSWSPIPSWCWYLHVYYLACFVRFQRRTSQKTDRGIHANVWSPHINASPQAKIDPVQHLRITALGNAIDVAATVAVGGPWGWSIRRPDRWSGIKDEGHWPFLVVKWCT